MSGTANKGVGWLPVEARDKMEMEQERASAGQGERLLALDPRARVLALLEWAASRNAEDPDGAPLSPADLKRVLESFPGAEPVEEARLEQHFPMKLPE
jgi:hypothetical protein